MCPKPSRGKRLQGAAAARLRARRRTVVLQGPGNAADAVPCERLQKVWADLVIIEIIFVIQNLSNLVMSWTSGILKELIYCIISINCFRYHH